MPHPVDIHVGERLRAARLVQNLSQTDLAKAVGLTFQQIQKYEKGTNRVSASKLFEFAKFLNVEVSYFFKDFDDGDESRDSESGRPDHIDFELAMQLTNVSDLRMKRAVLALLKST